MKSNYKGRRDLVCACVALGMAITHAAHAQPVLEELAVEPTGNDTARVTFRDTQTGATGYEVEYTPGLGSEPWTVPDATLANPGDGRWQVDLSGLDPDRGFFRVKLLGIDGAVVAYFDSDEIVQAVEGGSAAITVHFTAPYFGLLRYRWSGTAAVETPTGVVQANGTTATIQLEIGENQSVDELTHLSLSLETAEDTGYTLDEAGDGSNVLTLMVTDNDGVWAGAFTGAVTDIELQIELIAAGDTISASLIGGGSSIMGNADTSHPAEATTSTAESFQARFVGVPVSEQDATADLELTADAISDTLIQGPATLTLRPGGAHLQTTIDGRFTLVRRPARQSTTEVPFLQ